VVVVVTVFAGCSAKGSAKDTPDKRDTQQAGPPGPFVVAYDCSHSNMPFGPGGWSRSQSANLATHEWTLLEITTTTNTPTPTPPPPPEPTVKPMSVDVVAKLQHAVDAVLAGGPYKPEYPVPEGTPCTLTIKNADTGATVFTLAKADTALHDAVSDLIVLFRAVAGT
jgi:hypothetical protein